MSAGRTLRQALTVARRDFVATVFAPTFLLFLLAPLITLSFGALGGLGAATMADSSVQRIRLVALVDAAAGRDLVQADVMLRTVLRGDAAPATLEIRRPGANPARQARTLLTSGEVDVAAVLYGPLDRPVIATGGLGTRSGDYMALLAETATRAERGRFEGPQSRPTRLKVAREASTRAGQQVAGFGAQLLIFIITLLLGSQATGMLAEERNNKVIEVLAAAVPLEAVFFGKLLGLFGVAVLFVGFWGGMALLGTAALPAGVATALSGLSPPMGGFAFAVLFLVYLTMAFLLLGSLFLGVGAQASTIRENYMLSLPITLLQVGMFGLSAAAVGQPGSALATFAEIFPFSSPFAMAGRAANAPEIWPHLAAIAWQAMWLAITISIGARAFRRGVLQSSSGKTRLSSLFRRPQPNGH